MYFLQTNWIFTRYAASASQPGRLLGVFRGTLFSHKPGPTCTGVNWSCPVEPPTVPVSDVQAPADPVSVEGPLPRLQRRLPAVSSRGRERTQVSSHKGINSILKLPSLGPHLTEFSARVPSKDTPLWVGLHVRSGDIASPQQLPLGCPWSHHTDPPQVPSAFGLR